MANSRHRVITGQLFFSVCARKGVDSGGEPREVLSKRFWKPTASGKWLPVATTDNVAAARTRHYLNDILLHEESILAHQVAPVTRFGLATIGNWTSTQRDNAGFAIRNLNGSLGEFAIFCGGVTARRK